MSRCAQLPDRCEPITELRDRLLCALNVGDAAASDAAARSGLMALADPSLKSDLSSPALALAIALDQGVGTALGFGKPLSDAGTSAIANMAGDLAASANVSAEVLGAVAEAVPMVGTMIKVATSFLSAAIASTRTPGEYCREWQVRFAPTPSGSILTSAGQPFVPADYFVRNIWAGAKKPGAESSSGDFPAWRHIVTPSDRKFRSLLGMGFMTALEGTPIDGRDLSDKDWKTGYCHVNCTPPNARMLFEFKRTHVTGKAIVTGDETYGKLFAEMMLKTGGGLLPTNPKWSFTMRKTYNIAVEDDYNSYTKLWRVGAEDATGRDSGNNSITDKKRAKRGLPKPWRTRFRRLRRGIEASWGRGDGGAALWLLYMDLIAGAFRREYLSRDLLSWQIYALSWGTHGSYPQIPCNEQLSDAISTMASNWQNTIDPKYDAGRQKIDALADSFKSIMRAP